MPRPSNERKLRALTRRSLGVEGTPVTLLIVAPTTVSGSSSSYMAPTEPFSSPNKTVPHGVTRTGSQLLIPVAIVVASHVDLEPLRHRDQAGRVGERLGLVQILGRGRTEWLADPEQWLRLVVQLRLLLETPIAERSDCRPDSQPEDCQTDRKYGRAKGEPHRSLPKSCVGPVPVRIG